MNFIVISAYAPTLDAEDEAKYSFYDNLEDAIRSVPAGDMLLAAGTGMQDPVQQTWLQGIPVASLIWARSVLSAAHFSKRSKNGYSDVGKSLPVATEPI